MNRTAPQDFIVATIASAFARAIPKQICTDAFDEELIATVSPASHGSFGDEALVLGAQHCNALRGYRTTTLTEGDPGVWPDSANAVGMDNSAQFSRFIWNDKWRPDGLRPRRLVVIGADSIDGVYGLRSLSQRVNLLNRHVRNGGSSYLSNFSIREEPSHAALRILRSLDAAVNLEARDKDSQDRAARFLDRDVTVAPDVAQFLQPSTSDAVRTVLDHFHTWRSSGTPIAVVVPNAHFGALYGSPNEVTTHFIDLIDEFLTAGFACALVAHDVRDSPGDPKLVATIASIFKDDARVTTFIPKSASEAKSVIGEATVCVSSRMHAAVAGLSQDVPCLGLDYVDKFRGQFAWYGQESNVIPREELAFPRVITNLAIQAIERPRSTNAHDVSKLVPSWISG